MNSPGHNIVWLTIGAIALILLVISSIKHDIEMAKKEKNEAETPVVDATIEQVIETPTVEETPATEESAVEETPATIEQVIEAPATENHVAYADRHLTNPYKPL